MTVAFGIIAINFYSCKLWSYVNYVCKLFISLATGKREKINFQFKFGYCTIKPFKVEVNNAMILQGEVPGTPLRMAPTFPE